MTKDFLPLNDDKAEGNGEKVLSQAFLLAFGVDKK
jgi:hypothetical protein